MNKKEAKKQRKLERKRAEEKRSKQKKLFGWAIPLILISIVSVSAFGFTSKAKQSSAQQSHTSIDNEEITPETWRSINLEIKKDDGSIAKIDLLRPLWWIEESQAVAGATIPLLIPEMGIDGDAKVIDISPCTVDSRNSPKGQRVVTGKFVHENAIVLDLSFNNDPNNSLGVTPNHPIWSQTQEEWILAGNLQIGEYVRTKDGVAQLTMRSQRPGRHKVYNLEVHKDHNYYVSNLGILAHNSCPGRKGAFNQAKSDAGIPRTQHPDPVEVDGMTKQYKKTTMTDMNGHAIKDESGDIITTREYQFTKEDGSQVIIQDHSAGHSFGQGGVGDQGAHFNVRPPENTRTGTVPGTDAHYNYKD